MLNDLKDKVVLITGSSTGIGAAAAVAFGKLGARVAVHYNSSQGPAEEVLAGSRPRARRPSCSKAMCSNRHNANGSWTKPSRLLAASTF